MKGVDAAGNQYWEDNTTTPGRTRYMIYADTKNVNASAIPPEWHGWMHYIIDETPVDVSGACSGYGRLVRCSASPRRGADFSSRFLFSRAQRPTALPTFHQPHQATSLSNLGASAAYLPPGHTLSKRFTPFGTSDRIEVATGEEEARPKMGSYQSWKPSNAPTPQKTRAEVETPKTERR